MKKFISIIFLLFSLSCSFAQIPQTMSYQGLLTGTDGFPVPDGSVSLTFRLYDSSENGDTLWQETQNFQVTNGIFNVILGSNSPLNLPFDEQYWLGISIGGDAELTPRTALTASPYSLNSHSTIAETQPGQGLTIRNSNGEATHQFDANGNVTHNGVGTFLGGILIGDTIAVQVDTSDSNSINKTVLNKELGRIVLDNFDGIGLSSSGPKIGVLGDSEDGIGVLGQSRLRLGVFGSSATGVGVRGKGHTNGVQGYSKEGKGVEGTSDSYIGVMGWSSSYAGVYGKSDDNVGVYGDSPTSFGVYGKSFSSVGIYGTSTHDEGVHGHSSFGVGVYGGSSSGIGVVGRGTPGLWAQASMLKVDDVPEAPNQERFLVWDADSIVKYRMLPAGGGSFDGVLENVPLKIKNDQGETVHQLNPDGSLYSSTSSGTLSLTDLGARVEGPFSVATATGNDVVKIDPGSNGQPLLNVNGNNFSGAPVVSEAAGDETTQVLLNNSPNKAAEIVINFATDAMAASYTGNVLVNGDLSVLGDIFKGGGGFKIDHPLDPADKYLTHSFVESPQRMNVYNGNVLQLDANGEAWVELPQWFEALNKDFRYQLTCIGGFAQVYIAQEIQDNRFKIAGGISGLKISWQVTGVRQDAFAKTHPLRVEEQKRPEEIGKYLHPDAFGSPQGQGIFYSKQPELKNIMEKYNNKDFKTAN